MLDPLPVSISVTPLRPLMDHAKPAIRGVLPATESFTLENVPRLTASLQRGEEEAFTWLHRAWSARIKRYCFALAAGDEAFADEIAQAVWLRIVRHVRVMRDEQALWNWIACAARHAAIDLRRTGARYFRAINRFMEWWRPAAGATEAVDSLHAALESALKKLTAAEQSLIDGRYFHGDSLEAIASQHGLTVRAVEGRLARLRARLRHLVAQELQSAPQ